MTNKGFDNKLYMAKQKKHILERIEQFDGKLYLEFGGKLFDDYHAQRVMPGFEIDTKIKLLYELRDQAEIIFCISASNIETTKIRADLGISYEMDLLRKIDDVTAMGIAVNSVLITQYAGQSAVDTFVTKLNMRGVKNYTHSFIKGYPTDIDYILSEKGFGANSFIETTKPLVIVTAPGPGSGKLATCLSQVYHEHQRGIMSGYAKFETFPIWNLPLKHPINLAYEAATADLQDVNMIDPYHLEAYGVTTVNYNRDVEAFPIVRTILNRIAGGTDVYKSPTDMGVNMAGYAITDNEICSEASKQEIISRFFRTICDYKQGLANEKSVDKIKVLMQQLGINPYMRPTVDYALNKEERSNVAATAIQLPDGTLISGKASDILSASSGAILNAIKILAGIEKETKIISPLILAPILKLKIETLGSRTTRLKVDDVLIALCISAATDPVAQRAVEMLPQLKNCNMHSTQMLRSGDSGTVRKLGINLTCEPIFPSKDLSF